ncbi:MAG: hypothetical protein HYX47_01970 [Burkholderiales bacterium]|nr:hypothetical protein [Burkholderiales bacterium]
MQPVELSVEALRAAFETSDWPAAKSLLDNAGGGQDNPEAIAGALRRAGTLIIPYPNKAAEKRRDELLETLEQYLAAGANGGQAPSAVKDAIGTLRVGEAGYRKLVAELGRTPGSKLEPTLHIAAAIASAQQALILWRDEFRKHKADEREIATHAHFLDQDGNHLDMDGVTENLVLFVSMTLQMEAHRNKWYGAEGHIVVPKLPEATEEAIGAADSTMVLAVLWRRWKSTEERARLLGRRLRVVDAAGFDRKLSEEVTHVVVEQGSASSDWAHRVAIERLTDKMTQYGLEIRTKENIKPKNPKAKPALLPMPPRGWVSNDEVHGISGLEQYLAYDITTDTERPGGLRLVEWVRGYSALKLLEQSTSKSELVRTKTGWQDYFAKFGLAAAVSEVLLSRLTFCRTSRDLFDHPFIRLGTGEYRLLPLALHASSVPIVILSTLSHLGIQFQRKGKAFEERVHDVWKEAGIKSYAFKAKRGDNEYEFDAVVPWGDYLFMIECKNRSLPFGDPFRMRYFDQETQENLAQVRRLIDGLAQHPDILAEHLPADAQNKTVVPMILNCFPFCAPGKQQGIYLYDYSAFARFFENGEIKLRSMEQGKIEEYSIGMRLWATDKPTPQDLLAQLEMPNQYKMVLDSLSLDERGFPLYPDWWVFAVNFVRKPIAGLNDFIPARSEGGAQESPDADMGPAQMSSSPI